MAELVGSTRTEPVLEFWHLMDERRGERFRLDSRQSWKPWIGIQGTYRIDGGLIIGERPGAGNVINCYFENVAQTEPREDPRKLGGRSLGESQRTWAQNSQKSVGSEQILTCPTGMSGGAVRTFWIRGLGISAPIWLQLFGYAHAETVVSADGK